MDAGMNSRNEKLTIRDARVVVTCPGRNFVTLVIETDQGVTGIGDATLNGRELAVASYLTDHVVPNLIGRDAHRIEDMWQFLYRGAYWRRGPVTMTAIAAVDTALWGHANGADIEATVDQVGVYREMGYRAVRAQSGIPGVKGAYGVGKGELYYEPADGTLPTETLWSTTAYLNHAPKLFERLRAVYGDEIELLHDVHHRLTPIEAGRLGKALEPYRLFWMEDSTPAENQEAFRLIRQHTVTPLAVGEIFNSIWDCRELIQNQLIDYIRTTVVHAGGITHLRRIADLASLYHVRTGSHGATDLSPVCMGAALHFDTWVPNFGIQEYMRHTPETDEVFPHDYRFDDGYLIAGETPGHGVTIDEKLAAKYPYTPKQLPVARLADGAMWNW